MRKTLGLAALPLASALLVPACHDAYHDPPSKIRYVDAVLGSDSNTGAITEPYKTITHALSIPVSRLTIYVAPGTYDAANGEVFPLVVPPSCALIGDEANKGAGASPTVIHGGAVLGATTLGPALDVGPGSTIAGFTITNDDTGLATPIGISLGAGGATIRNNTFTGNTSASAAAVYVYNTAGSHLLSGNTVSGYTAGAGLYFAAAGDGCRVESNTVTGNATGIRVDSGAAHVFTLNTIGGNTAVGLLFGAGAGDGSLVDGNTVTTNATGVRFDGGANPVVTSNQVTAQTGVGLHFKSGGAGGRVAGNTVTTNATGIRIEIDGVDLGGGAAGSAGGNTLSCSTGNDLWTNLPNTSTIYAQNNLWDLASPSTGTGATNDIYNLNVATVDVTGAAQAAGFCTP
jgi:nitrous oxidase accessory protein NosD